ncbi:hypothetical protein AMAG_20374 [Allomyces macrogynus ATCC 38327]|uniref:Uncharacterized protein n=1 Tax=Allomyces macrogynus (strain ATCC 38327) TaxID=578462 RepID=A0A0L0T9V3_ALLM3|nr:hypothetical protein AMAG_20374 [Allomyces macrogynus ATCC 38327]|eukprot:KNE71496.1 hypothetical protein AMAG_20374 [Allomyces macrogynus ATCC 38327]
MYPTNPLLAGLAQRVIAPTRADRDFADEVVARAAIARALVARGDATNVPYEEVEVLCAQFEKEVADLDRIGVLVAAANAPGVVGRAVQYLGVCAAARRAPTGEMMGEGWMEGVRAVAMGLGLLLSVTLSAEVV